MLPTTNTQRGVSYDPAAAKAARSRVPVTPAPQRKPAEVEARLDGTRKEYARYLDQTEAAWQERARDRGR